MISFVILPFEAYAYASKGRVNMQKSTAKDFTLLIVFELGLRHEMLR